MSPGYFCQPGIRLMVCSMLWGYAHHSSNFWYHFLGIGLQYCVVMHVITISSDVQFLRLVPDLVIYNNFVLLTHCGLVMSYGNTDGVHISSGNGLLAPNHYLIQCWHITDIHQKEELINFIHNTCLTHRPLENKNQYHISQGPMS